MFKKIMVFILLLVTFPAAASLFNVYFWNIDTEEPALGGAITSLQGNSFGQNLNPAAITVYMKPPAKQKQELSFFNALRNISLLVKELGSLPYDVIDSDEKWDDTKHHTKWMLYSLLAMYRFHYYMSGLTFSFIPLREVPVSGTYNVSSTSLNITIGIVGLVNFGISGEYYFRTDKPSYEPFGQADNDAVTTEGFGGSAGIYLNLGRCKVGLDYRSRPSSIFNVDNNPGFPVKDNALSLGFSFEAVKDVLILADLVNFNNKNREDFLSPRMGIRWRFFNHNHDAGWLYGGAFLDEKRHAFFSSGLSLQGKMEGFIFKVGITLLLDLDEGKRNSVLCSLDFSI